LLEPAQPSGKRIAQVSDSAGAIEAYKKGVEAAYGQGKSFGEVPFIAAFLRSVCGFNDGLPVHYPRARHGDSKLPVPPHPEGLAYEWFVANSRAGQNPGPRHALPDLVADQGLPILNGDH